MTTAADVVIVGAGPAGTASAIGLARLGHRVTLLDRAIFPRPKACSEYLNPAAVRLLADFGVLPTLLAGGAQPLYGSRVFARNGAHLIGRFTDAPGPAVHREGMAVTRTLLDATLVDAARRAGVTVLERSRTEELLYEEGAVAGVVVREQSGTTRTIRARLVIGADGLRSIVARRMGRRRYGHPSRLAFVAHLAAPAALDGHAEMHLGDRGYVGLNRVGPDLANVALVVPQQLAQRARGDATSFFFEELRRYPALADQYDRSTLRQEIQVTGPFAAWSGRITAHGGLLVGDAADFFDPFTGEGIFRALHGAALATVTVDQALRAAPGIVSRRALSPYVRARRTAFLGKWAVERLVGFGLFAPALFNRAVRLLDQRGLGSTFIGVTADLLPARAILNPWFLTRMVL